MIYGTLRERLDFVYNINFVRSIDNDYGAVTLPVDRTRGNSDAIREIIVTVLTPMDGLHEGRLT